MQHGAWTPRAWPTSSMHARPSGLGNSINPTARSSDFGTGTVGLRRGRLWPAHRVRHPLHDKDFAEHGGRVPLGNRVVPRTTGPRAGTTTRLARGGYSDVLPAFPDKRAIRKARRSVNDQLDWRLSVGLSTPSSLPRGRPNVGVCNQRTRPTTHWNLDLASGKTTYHQVIGHRLIDSQRPGSWLAWRNDGRMLAFSYDLRGAPWLDWWTWSPKKSSPVSCSRWIVLGMTFAPNGRDMASALEDGQSDLYLYSVVGKPKPALARPFDDLHPMYWKEGNP